MKRLRKGVLLLVFVLLSAISWAQNKIVSGKVTNEQNEPVIGATVIIKNSKTGTTTDDNGSFSISVPDATQKLVISSAGYITKEVTITDGTIAVSLFRAANNLQEVVVVGYGTQKKSNVTGAISSVKAADLANVPNGRIEQALQGRVSGVTVMQNSGQPGSASTIRVRGVTTFNNNDPLWVVDGVVVDAGGIGYLNQSDIESIEVLKDAASSAIYGTRAAAGVVLVTTKKGKAGKFNIGYNGFYGMSAAARKLDLLDATQYATLMNEREVADGRPIKFADPASFGKGTDWQDAIFNNSAKRYLHEISLSGGNDKSVYYASVGLQDQQGIVATPISNYRKLNMRLNSTHKISKIFTFGQTLGYTHQKSVGIGNTNGEFGGPLSSVLNLDPITPLIETDPAALSAPPYTLPSIVKDPSGRPYGISALVGQETANPLAYIYTRLGGYNWSDDIVGNAYLEAAVTKDVKVRSTLGVKKAYWGNTGFSPVVYLNANTSTLSNSYTKTENRSFNWNIENTITYTKSIGDHDFSVLAGQGVYVENIGGSATVTFNNLPITSYKDASFRFSMTPENITGGANDLIVHKITSLFGRFNYSYQDKYLLTGIVRQDASTRFGADKKYGIFPSFSAGWNIAKEDFWKNSAIISNLKIRGGYGVTGNDALDDFRYLSTVVGGYNYPIGNNGGITTGYAPLTLDNPRLHWEETRATDIAVDAQLFGKLNVTVDFFNKKTVGILRTINIPGYVGVTDNPWDNVADMKNTGIEVELGYRDHFGDLNFSVNGNFSYLKNTVTYVSADTNFITDGAAGFQSMNSITRTQVGHAYQEFFGYKVLGIFQTQDEILNYTNKDGIPIQPNARPGDFKWADIDGDGTISSGDLDKAFLGSNIPKYTFGFTINMDYKGFDFMLFAQGAAGNKIFQGLRRLDIGNANYAANALSRWTGAGTSNSFPRMTADDPNGNYSRMSNFYLEKGDYLRFKVIQLGYTLPNRIYGKTGLSKVRLYVSAENLLTFTNYTGYDPEVGGGIFGIDKGQYPQARTILGGLQIQF